MNRIVLFGGTFDPIHNGHLHIAREVSDGLGNIDSILYVPAGYPWMKQDRKLADPLDRLDMVMMATDRPDEYVLPWEVLSREPSYTVDTVEKILLGRDVESIYLLIGADTVPALHLWHRVHDLLSYVTVVVAQRPKYEVSQPHSSLPRNKFTFVENTMMDISSSAIRRKILVGESITGLVPSDVEKYISIKGLYKNET